jgi:hypothetical protein
MLTEVNQLGTTKCMQPTREEALRSGRVKYLVLSYECLIGLLRQGEDGKFIRIKGMPEDAMLVGFSEHFLFRSNQLAIKVWSSTFPVVPEGGCCIEMVLECSLYQEEHADRGRKYI